ncbi:fibronectin type III domain-containing protein [Vallitalea okinawensis]|uniref:fibronectin type III domain-containing protein n=1 Tax=Vallitalea okinawensis TaxID=2078660 RepID=UPI000CFCBD10|nr:VWA domain-containing protein [Vallitalea okinawensis]
MNLKRFLILLLVCSLIVSYPVPVQAKSQLEVVFIIDSSGSMGGEINSVKNNINNFVNRLEGENIDYRLGLISYEDEPVKYNLTNDVSTFKNNLSRINVSGGTENGLDAIDKALDGYTYYANSVKYFVLIGDEPIYSKENNTDSSIIQKLNNNDVILTAIGQDYRHCETQFRSIANATGGLYIDIDQSFSTTLTQIFDQIQKIPNVAINAPYANQWLSEKDNNFIPSLTVSDPDSDNLTFSYYLDSETTPRDTQSITNTQKEQVVHLKAFDAAKLSEGQHTLTAKVNDQQDTVTDFVNFKVDKTPPTIHTNISSNTSTISLSGNAYDTSNGSGMHSYPYRFTIGNSTSGWTSSTSYSVNNLTANTLYQVKFEARDQVGHISEYLEQRYTDAQKPVFTALEQNTDSIKLKVNDNNPSYSQYLVKVGTQYVDQSGNLTSSQEWITLNNKTCEINDLNHSTGYNIAIKARNGDSKETEQFSQTVYTKSLPPTGIKTTVQQESITISWDSVYSATGYVIEVDGKETLDIGKTTSYTHIGLSPESTHTYRVAMKNQAGMGPYSELISVTTLPYPPSQPKEPTVEIEQERITLKWQAVAGADSYELDVDGQIITLTETEYQHTGLEAETDHTYRLRAKNEGGYSPWSTVIYVRTYPYPPLTPEIKLSSLTKDTVTLTWISVEKAEGYELKVDGLIMDIGDVSTYVHENLLPLSGHTYEIRAYNIGGKSQWSEQFDVTTHPEKPDIPTNILATADENNITLTWYQVPYADKYEVEIDGNDVVEVYDRTYVHRGLSPDEYHDYRVRAVNISGKSEWSTNVKAATLPEEANTYSLTNVVAIVTNNFITLSWDAVAMNAEYEIEVDGELNSLGEQTIYQHTGLEANEFHTYKIRVKTEDGTTQWCAILSLSTLPNPPDAPTEIRGDATMYQIELRWDAIDQATGYDIQIDGEEIITTTEPAFDHDNLEPGTNHTYRVRAKNITGVTAWSPAIIITTDNPDYLVSYTEDEEFIFTILAQNVQDFSQLSFTLEYDPGEVIIKDLFAGTAKEDVVFQGKIDDAAVVVSGQEGQVTFTVDLNTVPGTSWSGEVTSIVFKALNTGETNIQLMISE